MLAWVVSAVLGQDALFPTQHGEPPGYPGCIAELGFSSEGQYPEPLLYEGSVEHWRTYFQKYLPIRSFFDRESLIKNRLAKDLAPSEEYAEPVYWVPRQAQPKNTGKFRKPMPVVRCKPGAPVFELDLGELGVGLYAVRVIGAVETKNLQRHRKPLYLRAEIDGNVSRLRLGYVDEFYSVAEIYFHAPEKRRYRAKLSVDQGSQVELLVHNIDLHDALAGTVRRAVKTRATLGASLKPSAGDEARDEMLWNSFPPLNAQMGTIFGMGGDDGKSNWPNFGAAGKTPQEIQAEWGAWASVDLGPVLMRNAKLNLQYTIDDLRARRPLPDPYPFKDDGAGLFFAPDQNWQPVSEAVRDRIRAYLRTLNAKIAKGETHDALVMLCRVAYEFPMIDFANAMSSVIVQPGGYGRDLRCRRRETHLHLIDTEICATYDRLFDAIDDGVARSVGRFVPWVKAPKDVIELLDVYLVQTLAKRYLRYHYNWSNEPAKIVLPAAVLGDPRVTDPWMDWLFSKTFVYPLPPSGLQDLIITGNDRDGVGLIGSFYYAQVEEAASKADELEKYIQAGGNARYDLRRIPKVVDACDWFLKTRIAGLYFPRIGDVTGPDKSYGAWFEMLEPMCRRGWRWTKDPRFGFVLKHYYGENVGASPRAPWLENRSRVVSNWFGLLESGVEHDDFRFRRAAMVRVGQGIGHQHSDTLDLQIYAHGYPMTIDGGQRGGYSKPADSVTRVHNTVEIDGKSALDHSWVTALSDAPGARYLSARSEKMRRQAALIDVDEGRGSKRLSPAQLRPNARLDPDVVTPNSYVFDVVRVKGGNLHTYCFHGTVEDEFKTNFQRAESTDEYLKSFKNPTQGEAPEVLEATWRMTRGGEFGNERGMAPGIWNDASGRKYTRLHLFGQKGAKALSGWAECVQWKYGFTNLFVQRAAADSVFTAVIEPFVGEPFIESRRMLQDGSVEIKIKGGRTDVLKAGDDPEFAFLSTDAEGLRQVTVTGGAWGPVRPAQRERTAKVVEADYAERKLTFDRPWPGGVFEIGVPGHWTTHTSGGAESYSGRVQAVEGNVVYCGIGLAQQGGSPCAGLDKHWVASNESATKFWRADYLGGKREDGRYGFRLNGPVTMADFGESRGFRLWEYGAGDTVRQSTFVSLRRIAPKTFEVSADVDFEIAFPEAPLEASTDGKTWSAVSGKIPASTIRLRAR